MTEGGRARGAGVQTSAGLDQLTEVLPSFIKRRSWHASIVEEVCAVSLETARHSVGWVAGLVEVLAQPTDTIVSPMICHGDRSKNDKLHH